MESILDALPGQPLATEAVEALNDATSVQLIPYSWSGTQVVTLLLDEDGEISGGRFDPPERATASQGRSFEPDQNEGDEAATSEDTAPEFGSPSGFGTRESGPIGTVETVAASQVPEDNPFAEIIDDEYTPGGESANREQAAAGADEPPAASGRVWVVGYDPDTTAWVRIDELDASTAFEDAEPIVREWLSETYSEQMLERLAVGPSEYELPG